MTTNPKQIGNLVQVYDGDFIQKWEATEDLIGFDELQQLESKEGAILYLEVTKYDKIGITVKKKNGNGYRKTNKVQ